ncbi:hypothetical protein Dimus_038916 [Dionaea muscipula]
MFILLSPLFLITLMYITLSFLISHIIPPFKLPLSHIHTQNSVNHQLRHTHSHSLYTVFSSSLKITYTTHTHDNIHTTPTAGQITTPPPEPHHHRRSAAVATTTATLPPPSTTPTTTVQQRHAGPTVTTPPYTSNIHYHSLAPPPNSSRTALLQPRPRRLWSTMPTAQHRPTIDRHRQSQNHLNKNKIKHPKPTKSSLNHKSKAMEDRSTLTHAQSSSILSNKVLTADRQLKFSPAPWESRGEGHRVEQGSPPRATVHLTASLRSSSSPSSLPSPSLGLLSPLGSGRRWKMKKGQRRFGK